MGSTILGHEDDKYLYDGTHPDAEGEYIIAEKFVKEISKISV